MSATKTCPECHESFARSAKLSAVQWESRVFCSRACAGADRRRRNVPKTIICIDCGRDLPTGGHGRCKSCYHAHRHATDATVREAKADANRRFRDRHPGYYNDRAKRERTQHNARAAVNQAVADGRLQRKPCEVCGVEPAEGHHDDYERALDVRWLCPAHHAEHHRSVRRAGVASLTDTLM